jgi:hypothetical protein
MSSNKPETACNTDVAATTDKLVIESNANDAPAPAAIPTVRPWTSDFLLPSISHREPKQT